MFLTLFGTSFFFFYYCDIHFLKRSQLPILPVKELIWYVLDFNDMTRITNPKAEEASYHTHS